MRSTALFCLYFALCGQALAQGMAVGNAALASVAVAGAPGAAGFADARGELRQARMHGSARMRFLGFAVYDATLWVEPGFAPRRPLDTPLLLELRYQRNFKGRDIAQRSLTEMRRVGPMSVQQEADWLQAMEATFPDVAVGDVITGVYRPGSSARFYVNGRRVADVGDASFSRLFFGIWLSDKTSEPALRTALLGLPDAQGGP